MRWGGAFARVCQIYFGSLSMNGLRKHCYFGVLLKTAALLAVVFALFVQSCGVANTAGNSPSASNGVSGSHPDSDMSPAFGDAAGPASGGGEWYGDRAYLEGMTEAGIGEMLVAELLRQLEEGGGPDGRNVSAAGGTITDINIDRLDNRITWSYTNAGDYDLNGEVGIADVTPIAQNYLASVQDAENQDFLRWIDGSGNGQIGVEDVTQIALNFGSEVSSYVVLAGYSDDGEFDDALEVPFSARGEGSPGGFESVIPEGDYTHFAVQAVSAGGERGVRSLAVYLPRIPLEIIAPKITSVTPIVGLPGTTVDFSANVTGTTPVSFEWDFGGLGNPPSSTLANPTVTLGAPGSYDVSVAVRNAKGQTNYHFEFSTWHLPNAELYASDDKGNPPLYIEFDASQSVSKGNRIVTYEWDFDGDGEYDVIEFGNPKSSFVYEDSGWVFPTVRITDDRGQSAVESSMIYVNALPEVVFDGSPLEGNSPLTVNFDASQSFDPDGETLTFSWDFNGDGVFDAVTGSEGQAQYFYALPGDYNATVRVTDSDGGSSTASVMVVIYGWRYYSLDSAGIVGEYPSLANINGYPAVSYFKASDGTLKYIVATEKNGRTWAEPIVVDSSGHSGSFTSLNLVAGRPAISYWNFATDDLMYARALDAAGGAWSAPVTVQSAGSVGTYSRLLTASGNPAILYKDETRDQIRFIRSTDPEGSGWGSPVQIAPTSSASGSPSIAIAAGHPVVSYYDGIDGGLKFVRASNPEGSAWGTPQLIDAFFGAGTYSSIAIVNDKPAIAYFDEWNDDLKFIMSFSPLGDTWYAPVVVDSIGDVGFFPSLAVYQGKPTIAYQDRGNSKLRFVMGSNSSGFDWGAPETLDHGPNTGYQVDFKVIGGTPCIAYYDGRNLALRFAAWF